MGLEEVSEIVAEKMDEIVLCFKPGVKISVFVRTPEFPDRDFVMTADNLDEVSAMIERSKASAP